jgi:two-component system, cell cycle response regulator DivK
MEQSFTLAIWTLNPAYLRKFGRARDGAAGIAMAAAERPDLILIDQIDGWEATRRLKADPATCDIPVIALSAHAMAGDREKALATGCDDFDTKPIEFDRLLAKIEQALATEPPP